MDVTRLDSRTIEVDDAHPFVFTSGSWRQITVQGLFNNTVSYSSQAGDRKVVRFVGTSITVLGGLQQYSGNGLTNNPPLSAFSVDDGPSVTYSAPSPPFYTAVSYYQSSELPMGEHVLTMRNTIDNDIVHVDAFIIKSPDGQTPQILSSDGSSLPNRPPPASPSVPSSSPGSSLAVASVSSTGTLSSNTGTTSVLPSLATTTTSGFKTVTVSLSPSIGDQTIVLGSQPSTDQPSTQGSTTINYQADLSSPPNRKPVIAAGVLGALVFVSLASGLAFLVWRQRRRRQQLAPSMSFPYPQSPQPFDHIPNEPLPHYERHQTPARELGPNTPDPLRPGTPESAFSDMLESTTEKKDLGDVGYPAYHNKGARMTMESNVSGKELGNAF